MPAIQIADLNNAKTDVDHIADVANSPELTATDRLGQSKDTVAGAVYKIAGITNRGAWAAATAYATKDIVSEGGTWFVCVVAHTSSGSFATDAASKWRVYQGITTGDLSATTGSTLVGWIRDATGAIARTVADWFDDEPSVMDFIPFADRVAIRLGTSTYDATGAINAAFAARDSNKMPGGTYKVVGKLTLGERQHLRGAGKYATKILFAPTAAGTCIEVSNGGSIVNQGCLSDLTIYSDDSTYAKVAIDIVDANSYSIERVSIAGSVEVGDTSYWSGAGSIGLQTRGRQAVGVSDFDAAADRPLVIAKNPNNIIAIDHFNFHNLYLIANGNPCVQLLSGVNLTQVSFTGYQAWVKGTAALKWHDTETTIVSSGLRIDNLRTEQGESPTDYNIDISHNYGLQNLVVDGALVDTARLGLKLRKVEDVSLRSYRHAGVNEALNVDATVKRIHASACFWQAGSTASVAGQRYVFAAPKNPNTAALPPTFLMDESANADRNEIHDGVISSTPIELANDATAAIGGTATTGLIVVAGKNDATAIFSFTGTTHTVQEISDPLGLFSTTAGTGSSTNVYWSPANSRYEIQNKRGSTLTYVVIPLGSYT